MIPRPVVAGALALAAGCTCAGKEVSSVTLSDGRYAMGTILEITLTAPTEVRGRALLERLFGIANDLDRRLSRFDPSSALSALNQRAGQGPQTVDPELAAILRDSVSYWRLTRGSFDVTVGPLVELWIEAAGADRAPSEAALAAARRAVGSDRLQIDGTQVALAPGMSIDLGGVAKGFALDRMLEALRTAKISSALLSFGQSSVIALGAPVDAESWHLLLPGLRAGSAGVLHLNDRALSVSESFGQSSEIDGRRYGHVLDPRTGGPLTRPLQAVVVAPSAARAEALSKALLILGERDGVALLEAQADTEALLVDERGKRWATRGWQDAVGFEEWAPPVAP